MGNNALVYYKGLIVGHFGSKCVYCGKKLAEDEIEMDHIVAKTKGGKATLSNGLPCCLDCNRKKNNKAPPIPIQLCFSLTKYRMFPKIVRSRPSQLKDKINPIE